MPAGYSRLRGYRTHDRLNTALFGADDSSFDMPVTAQ
jgi:hypothetical protein